MREEFALVKLLLFRPYECGSFVTLVSSSKNEKEKNYSICLNRKRAKAQILVFITPSLGFELVITALILDKLGISFCLLEVSDPGHPNMVPTIRPIDSTVYIYIYINQLVCVRMIGTPTMPTQAIWRISSGDKWGSVPSTCQNGQKRTKVSNPAIGVYRTKLGFRTRVFIAPGVYGAVKCWPR
jgi:hypothetical protein